MNYIVCKDADPNILPANQIALANAEAEGYPTVEHWLQDLARDGFAVRLPITTEELTTAKLRCSHGRLANGVCRDCDRDDEDWRS